MEKPTVALIIDWENIKYSCTNHLKSLPDIITLKKIARKYGYIAIARAYANWTDLEHEGDMQRLFHQNVEPVYVETRSFSNASGSSTIKGSVDIKIACDCIESVFKNPDIETFVIASGDGGFSHIVTKLKSYGKKVIPIGVRESTSTILLDVAENKMVFYNDLVQGIRHGTKSKKVKEALDLFAASVNNIRDTQVSNTLYMVKLNIKTNKSDFEEDSINISSFRHLAYLAEKENLVKIDSTTEPATAYKADEIKSDTHMSLHSGKEWDKFINALNKSTYYSYPAIKHIINSQVNIHGHAAIETFLDNAKKSQVLWIDKKRSFSSREQNTTLEDVLMLNTHHPRVQVYFRG